MLISELFLPGLEFKFLGVHGLAFSKLVFKTGAMEAHRSCSFACNRALCSVSRDVLDG